MGVTSTSRVARVQRLVVGAIVSATLGVAALAGPSGASSASAAMSPFCKTLTSFHPKAPPGTNYVAYRAWAKTYLPFFKKLASQAPNKATKTVLNEMVQIMQYESTAVNTKTLAAYVAAHNVTWNKGWKAFASAVMSCVTSLY